MSSKGRFERLVEGLVEAIEETISAASQELATPVASVGLYDNDYTSWLGPRTIYICSDARRGELLASNGWEGAWAFWDYDLELVAPEPEEHPEWLGLAEAVTRDVLTDDSATHTTVLEVVRRLNDPARLSGIARTDDFVAYRAERILRLLDDLNRTTPPATAELLRERHLVPVSMDLLGRTEWR
jgi:hypothetical protein